MTSLQPIDERRFADGEDVSAHVRSQVLTQLSPSIADRSLESASDRCVAAAHRFAEAITQACGVPQSECASLTYLIGELWRRVGEDVLAHV
jgi:hypothetical protein